MPPFTFEEAIKPEAFSFEDANEPALATEPFSFEDATAAPDEPDLGFDAFVEDLKAFDPSLAAVVGAGEVALQMGTGFAGALPATILGVSRAIIEGDEQVFPERFGEIQEPLTFEPRTEKGKEFSENVGNLLQKYSEFVDRTLVEPSLKPGQEDPVTALIGKVSGEAILQLLPLKGVGKRGKPKAAEAEPVDATLKFEAKAPEVPVEPRPERAVPVEPEIVPEPPARPVQADIPIEKPPASLEPFSFEEATKPAPADILVVETAVIETKATENVPFHELPDLGDALSPLKKQRLQDFKLQTFEKLEKVENVNKNILETTDAELETIIKDLEKIENEMDSFVLGPATGKGRRKKRPKADEDILAEEDLFLGFADSRVHPAESFKEVLSARNNARAFTEEDLAFNLKFILEDLPETNFIDQTARFFPTKADRAVIGINEIKRIADKEGFDLNKISQLALEGAARRFADPADAEFMLKRFLKKPPQIEAKADSSTIIDIEAVPTKPELPRVIEPEPKAPKARRAATPAHVKAREKALRLDPQTDSLMPAIAKLGGLNKSEMVKTFGLDPKDKIQSGVFGKPVLRKEGKSIDEMMESLSEENFLKRDEVTERIDPREFEEKFFEEESGNKQFSARQDIESRFDFNAEYENFVNSESYKLNVGIPVEEIAAGIRKANENLKDSLGIPEPGISISRPEIARQPGILNPFRSPRMVAKKFPSFAPIKKLADRAMVEQDTLRSVFNKRLINVNNLLKKGPAVFEVNKRQLDNILLQGDMLGKNFTKSELKNSGVPENVVSAYNSLRSAYNRALNIANKTKDERGQIRVKRRTGYLPHFFHDWLIVVDKQPVASARTMQEAVKMGNEARRAGGAVKIVPKQFEFPGEDMQAAVVGDLDYFKVQKNLEETFSMTPEEAGTLLSNFARMKGRSRFVGNFLERMGVEGWEKDLAYVHRHYFNMISRFSALDKFKSKSITAFERKHGDFSKEHSGIAEFTKNYINDINGNPTGIENLLNATLANSPGFSRFLGKHLGSRPSLQIASSINNAVAIAKLGLFNVSSAAVNASQLMMSNALLGPKWTIEGLKRATRIGGAKGLERFGKKHKANPDLGILKKLGIGLQQGLESGAGYSKFNQMGQLFNKTTALFQGAEWQLRASTGLGAYYKGLSEGMTKPQAIEFAKETNIRANFDYSIADAPSFIRRSGPAGQVLFQFKKFPIKALEFMTELKGAENARFWIPFVLVSGYYGLPGMEGLKNMVLRLTGNDIELASKEFLIKWAGEDDKKKALAKTLMFGAFSNDQLGGVDLSRRIGAGDFIPSQGRDLLGPFFSSAISATQLGARGEWVDALRSITTAPGNLAVALRNEGELTSPWDRGRLTTVLDKKGQVLKGLGFTTTQESIERDASRIFTKNKRQAKEDQKKAIDQFIKVMDSGDTEKVEEAIEELSENGVTSQQIKNEIQKKGLTRAFRAFLNLPKRLQAENLEVLGFTEK